MNLRNAVVAKNAGILLITDILSKVLLTVLSILVARMLGAIEFGVLGAAIAFSEMFSFLPNFGFKNYVNREVAKYPEKSGLYFSNIALMKAGLSLGTLALILFAAHFMNMDAHKYSIVVLATLIMLLESYIQFYTAFFRGFQKAEYEAAILVSQNFLIAIAGIVTVWLGYGLFAVMLVRTIAVTAVFIYGFLLLRAKILQPPYTLRRSLGIELLKASTPFTVLAALIVINAHVGIVLLNSIKGDEITGWYKAAFNLCGIFQFIPASVAGAILPAMTRFSKDLQFARAEKIFNRSIKYLLLLVLPVAAGTTVLADKIILFLYQEAFVPSILTLRILIWIIVLSFSNTIFNVAFLSIDREKNFMRVQILGTLVYIGMCVAFIPSLGHNGLALAAVAAQFAVFLTSAVMLARVFPGFNFRAIALKPLLASCLMALLAFACQSMHLFFILPVAAGSYLLLLLLLKTFDGEEIALFKTGMLRLLPILKRS
ncbi:flippase [candidate division KSB1 bacterium]|nr:flippase [candidate division KSB1 bacterium]